MIARTEETMTTRPAPAATIYGTLSLAPNARDYLPPRAVALLIRVAALRAPASFSKPNDFALGSHLNARYVSAALGDAKRAGGLTRGR
jgi:hypothetical protein